jgi:O-antigen/teichoic acid export membrane protein
MKDVSVSFFTTGVVQVVNIATGLLAAWWLLPAGRGELAAIILWPGLIAEMGNLGVSDALLYRAATRGATPRELFAASIALVAALSLVLIGVGLIVIPHVFANHSPEVQTVAIYFLCAYLPTYFTSLFVSGLFQGTLQITTWNMLRSLVPVTYLAGICLLGVAGVTGVKEFAIAYIAGQLVAGAAAVYMAGRRGWISWHVKPQVIRSLITYGVKVHVGEVLSSLRQRIDQAVIAYFLPPAELGLYAVALTVANAPLIIVFTLANVAFPKITQQPTPAGKLAVFGRYLRFSMVIAAGTVVALWILIPWLLPLAFGKPFGPAVPIANILLIGTLPFAAKLLFQQALKAWDRSLVVGRAEVVGLCVAIIAMSALMPAFGLIGVAWSLVLSQLAAAAMMGYSVRRELNLPVVSLFIPTSEDWQLTRDWVLQVRTRLGFRVG